MCYVTRSLKFTSGVTPADLLAASMAAKPSLPHACKALVGLETGSYHATAHSVRSGRPDALPTELSQLGFCVPISLLHDSINPWDLIPFQTDNSTKAKISDL